MTALSDDMRQTDAYKEYRTMVGTFLYYAIQRKDEDALASFAVETGPYRLKNAAEIDLLREQTRDTDLIAFYRDRIENYGKRLAPIHAFNEKAKKSGRPPLSDTFEKTGRSGWLGKGHYREGMSILEKMQSQGDASIADLEFHLKELKESIGEKEAQKKAAYARMIELSHGEHVTSALLAIGSDYKPFISQALRTLDDNDRAKHIDWECAPDLKRAASFRLRAQKGTAFERQQAALKPNPSSDNDSSSDYTPFMPGIFP
jgi:hypothetical protein